VNFFSIQLNLRKSHTLQQELINKDPTSAATGIINMDGGARGAATWFMAP